MGYNEFLKMTIADLKKALKEKKVIFGTNEIIKQLKIGKLAKVFIAGNCPEKIKNDVLYYGKLSKVEIEQLEEANDEIAIICKKPFSITVLGY